MIHVVAMKCLTGLPLLIHIELLLRSRSRSFKHRGDGVGVGSFKNREVGVGAFVYRLHSPDICINLGTDVCRTSLSSCGLRDSRRSESHTYRRK
jgi:hypothetical protein